MMPRQRGKTNQLGRFNRFTTEQINRVREAYAAHKAAARRRVEIANEMDISMDHFCKIGRGERGKKPRLEVDC